MARSLAIAVPKQWAPGFLTTLSPDYGGLLAGETTRRASSTRLVLVLGPADRRCAYHGVLYRLCTTDWMRVRHLWSVPPGARRWALRRGRADELPSCERCPIDGVAARLRPLTALGRADTVDVELLRSPDLPTPRACGTA